MLNALVAALLILIGVLGLTGQASRTLLAATCLVAGVLVLVIGLVGGIRIKN